MNIQPKPPKIKFIWLAHRKAYAALVPPVQMTEYGLSRIDRYVDSLTYWHRRTYAHINR